jgi:phage terminase large subunit
LLYVSEAWSSYKATPNELKEKVKELTNGNLIVADSAEPRLIDDIKKHGCNIKAVSKTTIEEGIRLMREFKMIVDSRSIEIGKELNNYCEKDSKPIDSYNHRLDAIRYYLTNMHYNYKPKPLKIIGR